MADILLTFHCAPHDTDMVARAIRTISDAPVHVCEQTVHGRDFDDASTAERVAGRLRRSALELIVDEEVLGALVQAVGKAARSLPVRWHSVPVLARGRIA
mgnify:CR=1 FL=1